MFGRDWTSKRYKNYLIYENKDGVIELPSPKLEGDHQFENAGIAITALKLLKSSASSFTDCMQNVVWPARLHKLTSGPLIKQCSQSPFQVDIWIDGGHNQAAATAIANFLSRPYQGTSHIILGMIASKELRNFASEIANLSHSICFVNIPDQPASMQKETMLKEIQHFHRKAFTANSVSGALYSITNQNTAGNNVRVIVCGSLYLCGHILKDHN